MKLLPPLHTMHIFFTSTCLIFFQFFWYYCLLTGKENLFSFWISNMQTPVRHLIVSWCGLHRLFIARSIQSLGIWLVCLHVFSICEFTLDAVASLHSPKTLLWLVEVNKLPMTVTKVLIGFRFLWVSCEKGLICSFAL